MDWQDIDWQHIDWHHAGPYIVPVIVLALFARRLIKNEPRKVRLGGLFVLPLLLVVAVAATLANTPAPPLFWMVGYAIALVLGAGVGFLTTHHQEFTIDPATGTVMSRATPIGTILIVILFALRFGLKLVVPQMNAPTGGHPSADVLAWTDAGLIFSTGLMIARAATTWFHARPLIAAHRAANPPA
ncbi:MAG TPA: hypothetical protein VHU87_01650 [Rhizomicrobium sp.]|jgi:hypothetical protein|nr:hypothetical protein [Rhizomicrobium sp.]